MGSVFFSLVESVRVLVWYIELSLVSTLVSILAAQTFPEQGAHPSQLRTAPNSGNAPVQGAFLYVLTCQRFAETFHRAKKEQQRALPKCVRLHPRNVR